MIDLNGHNLDASASTRRPFEMYNGADLTINGVGATITVGAYGLVYIPDGASNVTLNGGNYVADMDNGAFIKPKGDDAINITLNNVTLTDASADSLLIDSSSYAGSALKITVNGGTYDVWNGIHGRYGEVVVTGATLNVGQVGVEVGTGCKATITNSSITVVGGGTLVGAAPNACVAASSHVRGGAGGQVTVTNCALTSDSHVLAIYSDNASSITATGCTITHTGAHAEYEVYEGTGVITVDGVNPLA